MVSWVFYFSLLLQCYISSVIIVNGWEEHYRISNQLVNNESRIYGWAAIQWVMVALPIGMIFVNYLFGTINSVKVFKRYNNKPIESFNTRSESKIKLGLYFLSVISFLTVLYTFLTIGYIPQLAFFSIDGVAATMREEVGRGFEGNSIIRNIFGLALTPILSYIWFSQWKLTGKVTDRALFYCFFFLSVTIVTYNVAKAPLIFYLLGFLFLKVYIQGQVKFKSLFLIFFMFLILIISSYYLLFDSFEILSINKGIGGRILIGQSMGVYFSFDIFPTKESHIYMSSISRFISDLFNIGYLERSSAVLMQHLNPSGIKSGTAGVLNTLFIGEAWANFGLFGVIFSPFIVGMYIQTIYMFFITSKKHPIYLGLFAYLSYRIPVAGGFNDFLYNPVQWVIFFIIFSILIITSKSITK